MFEASDSNLKISSTVTITQEKTLIKRFCMIILKIHPKYTLYFAHENQKLFLFKNYFTCKDFTINMKLKYIQVQKINSRFPQPTYTK